MQRIYFLRPKRILFFWIAHYHNMHIDFDSVPILKLTNPLLPASSTSKAHIAGSVKLKGDMSHIPIARGSINVNSGINLSRPTCNENDAMQ